MTRAWFLGLLVFVVLAVGLASLRGAELALAIPFLLYWMYALWRTRDAIELVVHRELSPEQVVPGEPVVVKVRISNAGGDLEELAVEDALPSGLEVVHGSIRHLIPLAAGKSFQFAYTVRGSRGGYPFGTLRAEASDSLGLLRKASDFDAPARLMVMPVVSRIKPVPIRPRRTRVYAGSIPARVGGPGTEFFGVRPYEVGDSARHINWRAVARHPESVFSNEFQQERVADVAVILDGRQRTDLRHADGSLFEHSVVAAGSLASSLLQQGNRVGLLIYSHYLRWTFPGYGKLQRERILHALAAAAPGASQVFEGLQYLPTRLFPSESQIVLVSPLLEDDLSTLVKLRARGYQVLVICPDPVAFEVRALPRKRSPITPAEVELAARIVKLERSVMLGRLRRAGVQVLEWDVAQPFDRMMHGAFRRIGRQRA